MNINLHIERLILDGLPVGEGQGPFVQEAVERELAEFLAAGGVPRLVGNLQRVQAPDSIALARAAAPGELGAQIAGAVYGALSR